jgi:hypothetical protein
MLFCAIYRAIAHKAAQVQETNKAERVWSNYPQPRNYHSNNMRPKMRVMKRLHIKSVSSHKSCIFDEAPHFASRTGCFIPAGGGGGEEKVQHKNHIHTTQLKLHRSIIQIHQGWSEHKGLNHTEKAGQFQFQSQLVAQWLACFLLDKRFAGSDPAENDGSLRAIKIHWTTFFGGEVKQSVPLRKILRHVEEL